MDNLTMFWMESLKWEQRALIGLAGIALLWWIVAVHLRCCQLVALYHSEKAEKEQLERIIEYDKSTFNSLINQDKRIYSTLINQEEEYYVWHTKLKEVQQECEDLENSKEHIRNKIYIEVAKEIHNNTT